MQNFNKWQSYPNNYKSYQQIHLMNSHYQMMEPSKMILSSLITLHYFVYIFLLPLIFFKTLLNKPRKNFYFEIPIHSKNLLLRMKILHNFLLFFMDLNTPLYEHHTKLSPMDLLVFNMHHLWLKIFLYTYLPLLLEPYLDDLTLPFIYRLF